MLKLTGVIILFSICTATGILKSAHLKTRVKLLEAAENFIKEIETSIRYTSKSTAIIVENAYKSKCCDGLKSALDNRYVLNDDEISVINEFVKNLGKTDTTGQMSYCTGYKLKIAALKDKAYDEYKTKSKMYRTLGICLGLAVSIIVI